MLNSAAFFIVKAMQGTAAGNGASGAPRGPAGHREAREAARRRRGRASLLRRILAVVHDSERAQGRTGHGLDGTVRTE